MRALVLDVPQSWLDERAKVGLDRHDEMWQGVLHIVPAPGFAHQEFAGDLFVFFKLELPGRGIRVVYETAVHLPGAAGKDYRIPDLLFFRDDQDHLITARGIEGAPLAVLEVRSPGDETYDKLDFWAGLGVAEVIVLDPGSRTAEVYRLAGRSYVATSADDRGRIHAQSIDVRFSTVAGDPTRLRVESGRTSREI